jgi:hypothetical protein
MHLGNKTSHSFNDATHLKPIGEAHSRAITFGHIENIDDQRTAHSV